MNFQDFYLEAQDFKTRIINAFKLQPDQGGRIFHRKKLQQWVFTKLKQFEANKPAKPDGFLKQWFNRTELDKKKQKFQKELQLLNKLKQLVIDSEKVFAEDSKETYKQLLQHEIFSEVEVNIEALLRALGQTSYAPSIDYYGYVKAPLIGRMLIMKRQHFRECVQSESSMQDYNLKYIVTQDIVAHKYQRNMVQEVFGRVIRKKGSLSLVIKIEIAKSNPLDKEIELYCYIQDLSFRKKKFIKLSELKLRENQPDRDYCFTVSDTDCYKSKILKLEQEETQNGVELEQNGQSQDKSKQSEYQVDHQSVLQAFLSEMFVIPVQTLVSDFIIEIDKSNQKANLIKYHQGSRQQFGQSTLLKDHPSIRNPLFYCREYIMKHEISTSDLLKWSTKQQYSNFYSSLKLISELMINDFSFTIGENQRLNSMCFNERIFLNMWRLIHEVAMISDWVDQVITPIKDHITIHQIMNKFSPIFSQMVQYQGKSFEQFRTHLLNLEADTFMTTFVPKAIIEKYKDLYIPLNSSYEDHNTYETIGEVYEKVFAKLMDDFDLKSCDLYEAVYFLNFVAEMKDLSGIVSHEQHKLYRKKKKSSEKNNDGNQQVNKNKKARKNSNEKQNGSEAQVSLNSSTLSRNSSGNIGKFLASSQDLQLKKPYHHPSWGSQQIWKQIYKLKQKQSLAYITLYLDMLGFYLGINTVELSARPFQSIKNQIESDMFIRDLEKFIYWIALNHEKSYHNYFSILFQKAYRFKKYKTCNVLLEYDIFINDFEELFQYDQILTDQEERQKKMLAQKMQRKSPQMHRRLKWEQLLRKILKETTPQMESQLQEVYTFKYGSIFIRNDVISSMELSQIQNNISRKSYMFDPQRCMREVYFTYDQQHNQTQKRGSTDSFGCSIKEEKHVLKGNSSKLKMVKSPSIINQLTTKAFIQYPLFPLVKYFYQIFLQKLNKSHLMPNFTGFLTQDGVMLHLVEFLPHGLNFQKGYSNYSESDLKNLLDKDELSQAIILSIILMPSKVLMKNIIVIPSPQTAQESYLNSDTNNPVRQSQRKDSGVFSSASSIFMIDFKDFYRKDPIQKRQGNYQLKSKNCLFTFDQMNKSISSLLMKKFSEIDIMRFVEKIFLELSLLIKQVNKLKKSNLKPNGRLSQKTISNKQRQLLGLIFEENFIINMTERMFKIRNCFINCLEKNKTPTHMEVLEMINPQLSYFYAEIIKSSPSLIQREKLMLDDMWRKPFLNRCSLIDFFACSAIVPQPMNSFPNHYKKLCFEGPSQNLNALYNQSKKFQVYKNDVRALDTLHHEILEYYVRNLDFSKLGQQDRKIAVDKLQEKSQEYLKKKGCLPLKAIKLQDVDIMKASELKFSYERLKEVILESINTNDIELSTMLKELVSVICIRMRRLRGLKSLGEYSYLQFSLEMRNLRILSICDCEELQSIDIKCDALENVTVRDNKALETLYIMSSSLRNLDCTGSNSIKLENVGVYILKGLNVLLAEPACDGYLKKLRHDSYSAFVFNVLKFLFNRVRQSEVKAIVVVTLTRLKCLNQEMIATMVGLGSNKISALSNLLLKYNFDLERKVTLKLVELFFTNPVIDVFPVITDAAGTNLEQICFYVKEQESKQASSNLSVHQFRKTCVHSFKEVRLNAAVKVIKQFQKTKNASNEGHTESNSNSEIRQQVEGSETEATKSSPSTTSNKGASLPSSILSNTVIVNHAHKKSIVLGHHHNSKRLMPKKTVIATSSVSKMNYQLKQLYQYLRINKHFRLHVEGLDNIDENDESMEVIKLLTSQRQDVEKVDLILEDCTISTDFFEAIFNNVQVENCSTFQEKSQKICSEKAKVEQTKIEQVKPEAQQKLKESKGQTQEQTKKKEKLVTKNQKPDFQGISANEASIYPSLNNGSQKVDDSLLAKRKYQKVQQQEQNNVSSSNLVQAKIFLLDIRSSHINNGISSKGTLECIKELKLMHVTISNFQLMKKMYSLVTLEINKCNLPINLKNFYDSIGTKSMLRVFRFCNMGKESNPQGLDFQALLKNLLLLKSLDFLDFSNNGFNKNQLLALDQFISEASTVKDLVLKNKFYQFDLASSKKEKLLKNLKQRNMQQKEEANQDQKLNIEQSAEFQDLNEPISSFTGQKQLFTFTTFLNKSKIKSLQIEFQITDTEKLAEFITSLSTQTSLLKLHLLTESEIPSKVFSPLNANKTINSLTSNQQIPTWLKKHVKRNNTDKSKIDISRFSGEFDIGLGNSSKLYDHYKVGLSLDGGGVRGLLLATELSYLAKEVGYPMHKVFDVVGGTSIGGIMALALTGTLDNVNPIMDSSGLVEIFTRHGSQIFKKSQIRQLTNLYDTKYSPQYLENLLNSYFKDTRLSDTLKETNCIVTAVSRLNNKDVIFKSTDAILNRDKDFYMKDIGRATSAAPTYFPSAQIKNVIASEKLSLVDGGMGLNNPSKLVIDQIKKMAFNANSDNFFLLSLGTGRLPSENIPENAGIKDIVPIMDSFTESAGYFTERDLAQNYKGKYMRVSPIINLTKKEGELDSTEPEILKTYQETGLSSARDSFSNTIIFGKYRTMNLVQWLRQNTERKYDL